MWVCIFTLFGLLSLTAGHQNQRVAPGVPPQHYNPNQQAPPPHQHMPPAHQHQVPINQQVPQYQQQVPQMQQVPLQQQQVPIQQQQVPMQQQQHVPIQHQQQAQFANQPQQLGQQGVPVGHAHEGGHQAHNPQLLNVANMMHEKEHIQEHMEVPMDTSKMSEQELQFHYFKMHDADNNNKLDGCELIKSLIHWHEQGHHDPSNPAPAGEKIFKDDELIQLIDPILGMDDGNRDGFIDYPEFVQAQQKASATGGPAI